MSSRSSATSSPALDVHLSDETRLRIRTLVRMSQQDIPAQDTSSSDDEEQPFVPFQDRPEWSDVQPEPQDEGPDPVAVIAYTDRFRNTFDYFRAILRRDERSPRALRLTSECCDLNPANYTVWYFRRILLQELQTDLRSELAYISSVIRKHPKNYQVWQHRKCIVERLEDASEEKAFTAEVLDLDSKNYHAWQHRQWVLVSFKEWDDEIPFTASLIDADVRNNSAWNHRFFVIQHTTGLTPAVVEQEIEFTLRHVSLTPHNESAWNYLRGLLSASGLNSSPRVTETCSRMLASPGPRVSPHLAAFVVDATEQRLEATGEGDVAPLLQEALRLCDLLASEWDAIRVNYWTYVRDNLVARFAR